MHGSRGDGNPADVEREGNRIEQTTKGDDRIRFSGIGYRRHSGDWRTLSGETKRVRYDGTDTGDSQVSG